MGLTHVGGTPVRGLVLSCFFLRYSGSVGAFSCRETCLHRVYAVGKFCLELSVCGRVSFQQQIVLAAEKRRPVVRVCYIHDGGVLTQPKMMKNARALASRRYVEWQVRRCSFSSVAFFLSRVVLEHADG